MLAQVEVMQYVRQHPPFNWTLGRASVNVAVSGVRFAQDQTALLLSPRDGGAHTTGGLQALDIALPADLQPRGHLQVQHGATVSVDTVGFDAVDKLLSFLANQSRI